MFFFFGLEQISPDFRQASHLKVLVEEKIKQGENIPTLTF